MQETDMHSSLSFYEKLGEENYVKIRLFHKIMVEYFYNPIFDSLKRQKPP